MDKNIEKKEIGILKSFFYSLKKIWGIDKVYIIYKFVYHILSSISIFAYSYIIKLALDALERQTTMRYFIIIESLFVSLALIISIICNCLKNLCRTKEENIIIKLNQQLSLDSISIDYELFEREDLHNMYVQAKKGVSRQGLF